MTIQQMHRLDAARVRVALSRALKHIWCGDLGSAIELLQELADRVQDEGWRELAVTLRLAAAALVEGEVAVAKEHWYEAWGYVAGVDYMQRQRSTLP